MITRIALFALALGFSLSAAAAPKDDATALTNKLAAAFNASDPKAAAALFAEDSEVISPSGVPGKGRAGAEKVIGEDMKGVMKGATDHKITVENARELAPKVWFVDATHTAQNMKKPDGTMGMAKLHVVFVMTMAKDGKTMQFAEARPYMFMPPPAAASGMGK